MEITMPCLYVTISVYCFFFQAEDGIRDLVRSRGLGDVYKRQLQALAGDARGEGHRVLLGDADVEVTLREALVELHLSLIHI